ncbi:MAG: Topoisomerase IA [Pseudolabrys sp.]|nr:Topoisomerase IA [Pseudolabrys sp.]
MNMVLPTNNEAWGFWGTIRHHDNPEQAWPVAFKAISTATGCADEGVRDFLDSRHGRHFADDVTNGLFEGRSLADAIDAAIERWMTWTIDRRTSRETGIPRGLPYLVGFVTDCEMMSEADA